MFCSKCPRGGEAETIAGGPELLAVGRGTDGYRGSVQRGTGDIEGSVTKVASSHSLTVPRTSVGIFSLC